MGAENEAATTIASNAIDLENEEQITDYSAPTNNVSLWTKLKRLPDGSVA